MQSVRCGYAAFVLVASLATFACGKAHASERAFEPVPQSSQRVQTLNNVKIVTGDGARLSAGASLSPVSARQAWLSVSVKNTASAPVDFSDSAVKASSEGKSLALRRLEEGAPGGKDDGHMRDNCAHATSSSQLNCNIDSFTKRQQARVAAASQSQLAPGQLETRRYQLTLPKRSKQNPTKLSIGISVGGELVQFDFTETN